MRAPTNARGNYRSPAPFRAAGTAPARSLPGSGTAHGGSPLHPIAGELRNVPGD